MLDRKAEIEQMLQSSIGERLLQIPDKFGNLPLMIAIIRNNFEYIKKKEFKSEIINS